jgi:hypothetical protein
MNVIFIFSLNCRDYIATGQNIRMESEWPISSYCLHLERQRETTEASVRIYGSPSETHIRVLPYMDKF